MTGVATKKSDAPRARDEGLTAKGKETLERVRATNAIVVAITNEAWGKKLDPIHRRAIAEYMRRFRLDIGEVDVLGGRPYRNGYYYRRRLAELTRAGFVEWYTGEHIGPDPRLDAECARTDAPAWAVAEQTRRLQERIRLAVPAGASHVFVARVKLKNLTQPLEGCNWVEPGLTKMGWRDGKRVEVDADPVGEENPTLTAETRAWRRVGLLAAAEIPELRAEEDVMLLAAGEVVEVAADAIAKDEAQRTPSGGNVATEPAYVTEGAMQPIDTRRGKAIDDPYVGRHAAADEPHAAQHQASEDELLADDREMLAREEGR